MRGRGWSEFINNDTTMTSIYHYYVVIIVNFEHIQIQCINLFLYLYFSYLPAGTIS